MKEEEIKDGLIVVRVADEEDEEMEGLDSFYIIKKDTKPASDRIIGSFLYIPLEDADYSGGQLLLEEDLEYFDIIGNLKDIHIVCERIKKNIEKSMQKKLKKVLKKVEDTIKNYGNE